MAQHEHNPLLLLRAHAALGLTLVHLGSFTLARVHLEQGIALYHPQQHRSHRGLQDPGVDCLSYAAMVLWLLGYPHQALQRSREALARVQDVAPPFSRVFAFFMAAVVCLCCRQWQAVQEQAEAVIALSREQEFAFFLAMGTILRGWALNE